MALILDGTTGVPVTTVTGTLPVANGGSGVTTSTGTGAVVLGTSPTITGATITVAATAAPAFSAYQSGNQSITTATYTKIACNTESFDTNSNYDSATNYRFTPTVAGYYQLNYNLQTGYSTMTRTISMLYKNGAALNYGVDFNGSAFSGSTATYLVYANGTTDYFEMYAFLVGTVLLSVGLVTGTTFSGSMIRSA
jgi:hypothetical protein